MNQLILPILSVLASIDFLLTLFWVYRWKGSKSKKFKKTVPLKLIEANPIINSFANYFESPLVGILFGYMVVFVLQISLIGLLEILYIPIFIYLIIAIVGHIKNNLKTSDKYIIDITKEYNKRTRKTTRKRIRR